MFLNRTLWLQKLKLDVLLMDFLNDFELSISFERRYTFKNAEKWTFKNSLQGLATKIGKSSKDAYNQERPFGCFRPA